MLLFLILLLFVMVLLIHVRCDCSSLWKGERFRRASGTCVPKRAQNMKECYIVHWILLCMKHVVDSRRHEGVGNETHAYVVVTHCFSYSEFV